VSIRSQIPLLEALAALDDRIRIVDEDLGLRKGGLKDLRAEVEDLERRVTTSRESITSMEKTRSDLSVEVRQMNNQIEKSREKLARSRNERESLAAQREMEELRKLLRDREDEIQKVDGLADRARSSMSDSETRLAELKKELEGDAEGVAKALADREKERAELATDRDVAVKSLPPVLYRRYETIRTRRPKAIAKTHDGTCNGCHIAVPPMMFQKMLEQEVFEQCPNCKRILYYVAREAPAGGGADT